MWTEYLTLTLPYTPELADIAAKVGRAMDPDVGGDKSFQQVGDSLTCTTGCTTEFKQQAQAMMGNAALLHQMVQADYAARWPDHTPPTLAECEAFLTWLAVS